MGLVLGPSAGWAKRTHRTHLVRINRDTMFKAGTQIPSSVHARAQQPVRSITPPAHGRTFHQCRRSGSARERNGSSKSLSLSIALSKERFCWKADANGACRCGESRYCGRHQKQQLRRESAGQFIACSKISLIQAYCASMLTAAEITASASVRQIERRNDGKLSRSTSHYLPARARATEFT